jgi:hypothetical protein
MATVLKLQTTLSHDGTELQVKEITGAYNAVTNLEGWGAPNSVIANFQGAADLATLDITLPDGTTTVSIDVSNGSGFSPYFPSDSNQSIVLNNGNLGGINGEVIPDGLYNFTYTVVDDDPVSSNETLTLQGYFFIYFTIEACIHEQLASLCPEGCICGRAHTQKVLDMYTRFKGLVYSAGMGSISHLTDCLTDLQTLCNNTKCNNC